MKFWYQTYFIHSFIHSFDEAHTSQPNKEKTFLIIDQFQFYHISTAIYYIIIIIIIY